MGIKDTNCVHIKIETIDAYKVDRYVYDCINSFNRQMSYETNNNWVRKH